jgi:hypothetical protein
LFERLCLAKDLVLMTVMVGGDATAAEGATGVGGGGDTDPPYTMLLAIHDDEDPEPAPPTRGPGAGAAMAKANARGAALISGTLVDLYNDRRTCGTQCRSWAAPDALIVETQSRFKGVLLPAPLDN